MAKKHNKKVNAKKSTTKKRDREVKKRYAAQNLLVLAFGFALINAGSLYLFNDGLSGMVGYGASIIYLFIPAFFTFLIYNKHLLEKLDLSLAPSRWYFVALVLPVAFSAAAFAVSTLWPGVSWSWVASFWLIKFREAYSPEQLTEIDAGMHPFYLMTLQQLVMGFTFATFFAFGEELGWRGLLLKEWEDLGFWRASFLIGLVWGLFYFPLEMMGRNFPSNPTGGAVLTLLWCILLSPTLVWVKTKAKSVAAAALFMGMVQGVGGSSTMLLVGANESYSGLRGISGCLVFLVFNGFLYLFVKPTLKISEPES